MFGLGWKRKSEIRAARTFVEATGGGWGDAPDVMAADGGENADYVGEILSRASLFARENGVGVGEEFKFTITGIPRGISSPHEIIIGLVMNAHKYGLSADSIHNETVHFTFVE